MALACPHVLWRIVPFNALKYSCTESFEFFNCQWRWEYFVHSKDDDDGVPDEIVSVCLRRLTNSSSSTITKFSTIASIRDSDGEHHAIKISNHEISPLVSWRVWRKPKSYILWHLAIENNSCAFSLTLEPLDQVEYMNSLLKEENHDFSCLQELSRDFDKFLTSSRHADVILRCGGTEIKAHKDALCFRSKKFSEMLQVEEISQKQSTDNLTMLTLPCMDPVVFVILLRYIYTATLPDLTKDLARKIYKAAGEYSIESLQTCCAQFIIENLTNMDALDFLLFAEEHGDENLKWAVSSYIACDLNILNSDEWQNFSKTNQGLAVDVFKIFTERVNMGVSSEISPI